MKTPKLAAFDLDGTLLNSKHSFSARTISALRKLSAKGCIPVLATGRNYQGVKSFIEKIDLPGPVITSNGAMICRAETGEIIAEWPLDEDIIKEAMRVAREKKLHFQGFSNENIFYEKRGEESDFYESITGLQGELVQFGDWKRYGFIKALIIGRPSRVPAEWPELHEIRGQLQNAFGKRLQAVFSRPMYLDLMNGTCTKGTALRMIADSVHASPEETAAFGDALNDLPMLETAGISVAMKNAPEDLQRQCAYVTAGTNDEEGVADFIESYFL